MKRFAALFDELDATTATNAKVAALRRYLAEVDDADAAWAVYFLAGGKPRQLIKTAQLRAQAIESSGLPEWLFEASYQAVGDLAETIALVLPLPLVAYCGANQRTTVVLYLTSSTDSRFESRSL